ncbi:uncharacterized protein BDZ83DRAFT_193806 [Colletotrichum acutatum]|uniref:F-box domain-containing protein n=1 Tax=Glomerella acutata TaxID=27357 RepID=A0AAD8XGW9_GLOAC|nr:uncharacterized protein BDZ83DRAFT_193806 [Colletotrichum acutatum]KAK1727529.1 hypothetical protein BDZ83DRAFT_193806 [Colletotrichum acutatum]
MASTVHPREPKKEAARPEATMDRVDAAKVKEEQNPSADPSVPGFPFGQLSYDLQYEVLRFCDYPSATLLTSTNRHFYKALRPKIEYAVPAPERLESIQKVDLDNRNEFWACYKCLKVFPRSNFGDSHTNTKKTRQQRAHTQTFRKARRCWTCAIESNYYGDLQPVKKDGVSYFPCHGCGFLGTEFNRCRGDRVSGVIVNRQCHKDKELSPLERLSGAILRQIIGHLDYLDTIHLRMASCSMMHQVKLDWVAIHKRFAFVLTREAPLIELVYKEISRSLDESPSQELGEMFEKKYPYPCYSCFKVKPAAKFLGKTLQFAEEEPNRFWQRRCRHCCTLAAGQPEIVDEWHRRHLCSDCGMVRVEGEACLGCLETSDAR